jgi:hypothetical protein
MTAAVARPLKAVPTIKESHPGWCSPKRCRTNAYAVLHESDSVQIGALKVSVHHPVGKEKNELTYPVVCIETGPHDEDQFVQLRLSQAPDLARALLDLFTAA